jgi:large subunit ribosomal protein L15
MKELSELTPPPGNKNSRKRLGRGTGSGLGKTAGRGHKGQRARAGGGVSAFFEGGQMPLYRRLPKRGFKNILADSVAVVNVEQLNAFDDGTVVDRELLEKSGMVKGRIDAVKCLGRGELTKRLVVKLNGFSKSAVAKIEGLSGTAEVISGQ